MQVSNIEVQVANEVSLEVVVGSSEDLTSSVRFTELQFVGGGSAVAW